MDASPPAGPSAGVLDAILATRLFTAADLHANRAGSVGRGQAGRMSAIAGLQNRAGLITRALSWLTGRSARDAIEAGGVASLLGVPRIARIRGRLRMDYLLQLDGVSLPIAYDLAGCVADLTVAGGGEVGAVRPFKVYYLPGEQRLLSIEPA